MKIYVRPGHGGSDSGATANGLVEKNINLTVALEAKRLFELQGHEVKIGRTTDVYLSLEDGVNQANEWGADFFISIHHNAGGGDGAEIYHTIFGGKGKDLAQYIIDQFRKLGQNVRYVGARESTTYPGHDYYFEIKYTNMPALITEYAFLDTADSFAIDESHEQMQEAAAIVKGFQAYIGQQYKEDEPEQPTYKPPYVVDLIPQGIQMQYFDDHLEVRVGNGPWKIVKFD